MGSSNTYDMGYVTECVADMRTGEFSKDSYYRGDSLEAPIKGYDQRPNLPIQFKASGRKATVIEVALYGRPALIRFENGEEAEIKAEDLWANAEPLE